MKKNLNPKRSDHSPLKTVILTGGGSGGHLFPLQSVAQEIKRQGGKLIYLGRDHALEREVVRGIVDDFHGIPVGKFRRNLSPKVILLNLIDLAKVIAGFIKSFVIITRIRKRYSGSVIFSSGGFVSIPTVTAGFLWRIPIIIHEQTARAGLANRISGLMAKKICVSFPESGVFFNPKKTVYTGFPLREDFFKNPSLKTNKITGEIRKIINSKKPVILFSGGSNGSRLINNWVKKHLPELSKKYTICHQTGKNFLEEFLQIKVSGNYPNYHPLGFIASDEWPILLRRADVLVGRSGAGTVHECIHFHKKAIFIPLAIAQKNEQFYNASSASRMIDVVIIQESELSHTDLPKVIGDLIKKKSQKPEKKSSQAKEKKDSPLQKIAKIILEESHR